MDTLALQQLILNTPLQEQSVSVAAWPGANLIIRELDGKSGSDLMESVTDVASKSVDQEALVAGIVLATLRNADDPNKALVFSADPINQPNTYAPAFRDSLMKTGLGNIMTVAQQSLKLSGLADTAVADVKNGSGATVSGVSA